VASRGSPVALDAAILQAVDLAVEVGADEAGEVATVQSLGILEVLASPNKKDELSLVPLTRWSNRPLLMYRYHRHLQRLLLLLPLLSLRPLLLPLPPLDPRVVRELNLLAQ
jgi:hypothetical protein